MSDLNDLIELLWSKTSEGKLHWLLDGERRITTQQGNTVVDVDILSMFGGSKVAVRNLDGIVLAAETYALGSAPHKVVSQIFDRAKREALGVDKALNELRSSLLRL